jgi:hypothetical protein
MDRSEAVVVDIEQRIRVAGHDRRLGAGVADELNPSGEILQILGIANVSVKKFDAVPRKNRKISFTPAAHQIVQHRNFVTFFLQMKRNVRTDKTTTTGDQNLQEVILQLSANRAQFSIAFQLRETGCSRFL